MTTRYIRTPEHDRRFRRGDDFAGDAWLDIEKGETIYTAVGRDPNLRNLVTFDKTSFDFLFNSL